MHSTVRVLAAIPLAAALLSCGGGGGEPTAPPPPPVDLTAVNTITVTAPSLTVAAGKTVLLTAQATNVNGTVLTGQVFVWSTSSNAMATVEQNGMVLGVGPGSVIVAAAIGVKNGSVTLTITPAPVAATIAVNSGNDQTAFINTPVATRPAVIVKDAAGDPVSGVSVTFAVSPDGGSATGIVQTTDASGVATVGSWTMGSTAGTNTLTATSGTLAGSPATFTATAAALAADMRQYNTSTTGPACLNPVIRTGRIEAETARLTIVADVNNPTGGFTAANYQAFAATFESLVWPVLTENFGVPADIDNNGRVIAFFTRAVNELTPAGSPGFIGGFFYARDLFPKVANNLPACPGSNEAEMFYILVPDPSGSLGLAHSTEFVRNLAVGVIGHEMQHLINASRRLYINTNATEFEVVYLEEGLSHIAEEMLFYEASGIAPRSNVTEAMIKSSQATLDAANSYATSNLGRFSLYLKAPSENSPYNNNANLTTRGATWAWLRYLADRGATTPASGPACGTSITLALNGTCRLDGAAAAQFTIDGGSGGTEYTVVAFADGAGLTTVASATNAVTPTGPPSPSRFPGVSLSQLGGAGIGSAGAGLSLDMAFHTRLRAMERRELSGRVPEARARFGRRSRGLARFSITRAPQRASFAAAVVEPVWGRLVNSVDTGMTNLRAEFGQDIQGATRDWAVANYVDDAVTGLPSQYAHPSWNFRSVLPILSSNTAFPLQTQSLAGSSTVTLINGGAAYYRLGVAASTTSVVSFTVNGTVPPANLKLVVIRTK